LNAGERSNLVRRRAKLPAKFQSTVRTTSMRSSKPSSFPLKSLLLLVCGIAVVLAAAGSGLEQRNWSTQPISFSGKAGAAVEHVVYELIVLTTLGAIVGVGAGLFARRKFRGAALGLFIGALIGAVGVQLIEAPPNFLIVLLGSAVMIFVSLILRRA
jgi:hypothetical protein